MFSSEGIKYSCEQCDKELSSKGDILKHKRAVHEGVKYPCEQCGKEFSPMTEISYFFLTLSDMGALVL